MNGAASYNLMFHKNPRNGRHMARVKGYDLEVPAYWRMLTHAEIAQVDNGCGLDIWPDWVRRLLDALSCFAPAARIHDVEWANAICPRDIRDSNWRFLRNCQRLSWQTLGHVALPFRVPQFLWLSALAFVFSFAVWIGGLPKKYSLKEKK